MDLEELTNAESSYWNTTSLNTLDPSSTDNPTRRFNGEIDCRSSVVEDHGPERPYCPPAWDSLFCWPATPAGETVIESCSAVFSDIAELVKYPDAVAYRECNSTGLWLQGGWTNYSQCVLAINLIHESGSLRSVSVVRYIMFIGAILSLSCLSTALFIFTYFRNLECDRIKLHRNLIVALLIRFIVMLVIAEPFVSNRQSYTYRNVDWICKGMLCLRMYSQMASIKWMFVEGVFLHSRLTSNVFDFGAPFRLYYTVGWGLPLVFLTAWAATMQTHYPVYCWKDYGNLIYVWILVGPMITALSINLIFLVNIIRILVTKLRASDALETTQIRKAVKATIVLFPLLGITNLLFAVNPRDRGKLEEAYMITNALLQSSQGVFVSVLYCFINSEVQKIVAKRWRRYRIRHHPEFYLNRQSTKRERLSAIGTSNSPSSRVDQNGTPRRHTHLLKSQSVVIEECKETSQL